MADTIVQLVDALPADNITVKVLKAIDMITPGQWENTVGFDAMIQAVTGETNPGRIARISDRAEALYLDNQQPYQGTIRLYQTMDKADFGMATAALANKVGEKISFLGFLNNVTPKPDTLQSIDLVLKVAVELLAFCRLNKLEPNPALFVQALSNNYQDAALIRMASLVCIDALLPLGTDFLIKIHQLTQSADTSIITQNPLFLAVNQYLPGNSPQDKAGFVNQSFTAVEGWMSGFISKTGITPETIANSLGNFIQGAGGKLDVIAALLDQMTNYYEHTGIQTVARAVILAAHAQVQAEPEPVASAAQPMATPQAAGSGGSSDYAVGQRVDVWDGDDEDWYEATILKVREKKNLLEYKVHYEGYDSEDDDWVDPSDVRSRDFGDPDDNGYAVGQTVKVWDEDEEEWYSAVIRKAKEDEYFVHYIGYGTSDDEWVGPDDIT